MKATGRSEGIFHTFLKSALGGVSGQLSGFGGLVVSMLASGTQVRGFKPGRDRRIFRAKKSSACRPSEGK
jgi:hypothetical protein